MKPPIKVVMLPAKDQTYQIKEGEWEVEYEIQVKANTDISQYKNWTTVSPLLACGLTGIERKSILKLNQDNTIDITPVENKTVSLGRFYSEKDVHNLLIKHQSDYRNHVRKTNDWSMDILKWIKENLNGFSIS
jgi:hypothetical protein